MCQSAKSVISHGLSWVGQPYHRCDVKTVDGPFASISDVSCGTTVASR